MLIDDTARFELHEALRTEIGERNADTLMSMLPPVGWADVATKQDLENLETRLDARLARVEGNLHKALNRQTWSLISAGIAIAAVLTANNLL